MTPQLPSFLRRRLRLSEARKALLGGRPEAALGCLDDPCFKEFEEANNLRERVLDVLCREAAKSDSCGDSAECERLLDLVAAREPNRARAWRRRLADGKNALNAASASGVRRSSQVGMIQALEGLLLEMRDERTRSGVRRNPPSTDGTRSSERLGAQDSADERSSREVVDRCFRLAVDDIGEFLVVYSAQVTIGHAHARQADLPLAADVDPLHVKLIRTDSFHAGPGWRIEAVHDQRIAIGGQFVDAGGAALLDGDEVQLARNLAFVFRRPEAASGSALLEFLHGVECAGTMRVILFAPGEAGRVRISSRRGRHLHASRLEDDITLWIDGNQLVVECAGNFRAEGEVDVTIQNPGESGPGGLRVDCPPRERIGFAVGRGGPSGPPFGFSIAPAGRPKPSERAE